MPTIDTLVDDIYRVLDERVNHETDIDLIATMGTNISKHMIDTVSRRDKRKEHGKIWASSLGERCMRKVWYDYNAPELALPMPPYAFNKFLYGNIIEETLLTLAKVAGHEVDMEQERVQYTLASGWTLSGKMDARIDGHVVDVKSANSFALRKYAQNSNVILPENDSFGYNAQLWYYYQFNQDVDKSLDPVFLMQDKTLGHIKLIHPAVTDIAGNTYGVEYYVNKAMAISEAAERKTKPPLPTGDPDYDPVPDGKSGNMKLSTKCSYCPYKIDCHNPRTFVGASGVKHLTEVKRVPKMEEVIDFYDWTDKNYES